MARIRTIKPEFWTNEKLSALPEPAHMLAGALLNYADDEGYFNANLGLIKAACFPLREPSVSTHGCLRHLISIDYIRLGTGADGRSYGRVVEFQQHQSISRPTLSKIKKLQILWEDSMSPHGVLREDSTPEQGTGNREQGTGKGEQSELRSDSPSPSGDAPKVANLSETKAERLRTVTRQAIETFNAVLGKPKGLLPSVNPKVGMAKREKQVSRCIRVAREICGEQYGSTVITGQFWQAYFDEVDQDPFKSGRQPPGKGHENWTPSFEYLTREAVMLEVFERSAAGDRSAA